MNITITDFWTRLSNSYKYEDFTIKSDWYSSQANSIYLGKSKGYIYTEQGNQLAVVLVDDTFYLDFAFAQWTKPVIEQQIWILNCIENPTVEYKIEFVSLWEKFNLPTPEQLNAFAQIYKEHLLNPVVEVPVVTTSQSQGDYDHSVEELSLSTQLGEQSLLRNITMPLSEYVDSMLSMSHIRLNNDDVVHHATVIHNHHHSVHQSTTATVRNTAEDLYNESLQILVEASGINEPSILPEEGEDLPTYVSSMLRVFDENLYDITNEEITTHATNVWTWHTRTR